MTWGRRIASIVVVVGSLAAGLVTLWGVSGPGGIELGPLAIAVAVGFVTLLATITLLVLCLADHRFNPALVVPILVVAVVAPSVALDLPLEARFELARPAFEQTIADRGEVARDAPCPSRIGSFRIFNCRTYGSDTYFGTPGGFLADVGFEYLPDGVPDTTNRAADMYRPLSGPWHVYAIYF